jgi:transposase
MLQPVVRRTWAPQGQTPVHYSWDRRDRLSVVSAISISPKRRRLGLYFDIVDHNIRTEDFESFVVHLLRRLPHGVTLVMDRWPVHRSAARRLLRRFRKRLHIEWLPAYAPELNPVEQVWTHTKYADLPNYIPENVDALAFDVDRSLRETAEQQPLLRAFLEHTGLKL